MPKADTSRPWWFDPSLPARERSVLPYLLEAQARARPDQRLALFEDGTSWSYGETLAMVRRSAAALRSRGVKRGDRVICWLPGGPAMIRTWFAINYLGAVFVPLNTAYRGSVLAHVINNVEAAVMIAHGALVERLNGLDLPHLERLIIAGGEAGEVPPHLTTEGAEALEDAAEPLSAPAEVERWDIQSILFTSGTTGPSKGVLSPYLHLYTTALMNYGYLDEGEAMLVNLPLFHVGGTGAVLLTLIRGGSFYLVDGFDTARFWDQVAEANCVTTCGIIGAMGAFLAKAPPGPEDAANTLRMISMFPIDAETVELGPRFGFDYITGFNMTEISVPLVSDVNSRVFGSCGKPRIGVECRIVDAHDMPVPDGEVGELILRADMPWTMNAGYNNMPEATARAWRNGWFHTGDAFRRDEQGNYFFVDRLKDTIRRRGENISSIEVEAEIRAHPDVAEAIVVGVESEHKEEDVMAVVVAQPGREVDPRALVEFLMPRLSYFMVPRYVRVVAEIEKTETNKPRKVLYRDAGVTPDSFDREKAGLRLRRERLSP